MNLVSIAAIVVTLVLIIRFPTGSTDVVRSAQDAYELDESCSAAVHQIINAEMSSALVYLNMAAHFHHPDVSRAGFASLFYRASIAAHNRSQQLLKYLSARSARLTGPLSVINPHKSQWISGREALEDALAVEKRVHSKMAVILEPHNVNGGGQCLDPSLNEFLTSGQYKERVQFISKLIRHNTQLREMDSGLGEFHVDQIFEKEEVCI